MSQTSISLTQGRAFPGMLSDTAPHTIISYVNEEESAELPPGVMVAEGTAANDALNLEASDTAPDMIGIVVHEHRDPGGLVMGTTGFKPNATLGVLTHGHIWVKTEEAVTKDDAVYVRVVVSGSEVFGAFRDDADTDCINCSKFLRYLDYDATSGCALLEVNMTGRSA